MVFRMATAICSFVYNDYYELPNSHSAAVGLSAGSHFQLGLSGLGRSTMMGANGGRERKSRSAMSAISVACVFKGRDEFALIPGK